MKFTWNMVYTCSFTNYCISFLKVDNTFWYKMRELEGVQLKEKSNKHKTSKWDCRQRPWWSAVQSPRTRTCYPEKLRWYKYLQSQKRVVVMLFKTNFTPPFLFCYPCFRLHKKNLKTLICVIIIINMNSPSSSK